MPEIEERWRLQGDYRIEPFHEQEAITREDVVELWLRELPMAPSEAERRKYEILIVATTAEGELAAVSTAYLDRNEQLRMDLWHYRLFVLAAHRTSHIGVNLAVAAHDLLARRFASGEDSRAGGMLYVVENEGLSRRFREAIWPAVDFAFIGVDESGYDLRVRYFPGALAPEASA